MASSEDTRPVTYAVVGLGHISQVAVLPAFDHTRVSALGALVSGDPDKREALPRRHGVERAVAREDFERFLDEHAVEAVYIAVPNQFHRDYAVAALERGIHVLCEKPLAVDEDSVRAMQRAADDNGAHLMTAKRLHFDPANLTAIEIARSGALGELRLFQSQFSQRITDDDIRLVHIDRGGGVIFDMGIYCINAARYLFRAEPIEVSAYSVRPTRGLFARCDKTTSVLLRFPGEQLAQFTVSFDAERIAEYRLSGTQGSLRMTNAYEYADEMTISVSVEGEGVRDKTFAPHDQFAAEIDYFSDCIRQDVRPEPGADDAIADIRIIRAIHQSADEGQPVEIEPVEQIARPEGILARTYPPVEKPSQIHASGPTESGG